VLVPFFYGHQFDRAVHLSQILFVEVTLNATINVLGQAFLSTGRPAVVTALQGVGLAAIVPLMLVMIPRFGLTGAAFSLLLSTTLRLLFVMGCFPVLLRVAPPNLVPTVADLRQIRARFAKKPTTAN
jgi:O-antigen/teichoic acid export membrane protein